MPLLTVQPTVNPVAASVIVPTHLGAHRLPPLLAAFADQDFSDPWELVVVVDGLGDGTLALLADWQERLPLTIVTQDAAGGVASALTRGFDTARGEVLIRCDDDLAVSRSFVTGHVEAHAGRDARVVIGATRDIFERPTPYGAAYGRMANEHALLAAYGQPAQFRWQHVAACFSLRRHLWQEVGGFDERFAYGEDSELGYRLWRRGADIVIVPALEVGHRNPAAWAQTRVPRAFVSGASRRFFSSVHPEAIRPPSPARSAKARIWAAGVAALAAAVRTPGGFRRLGGAADEALKVLPTPLGSRLVSLLVEGAGRSGELHGDPDLHHYRAQKADELAHEKQPPPGG